MSSPLSDPEKSRSFATAVVARLREAGHETYWAGGCVRDELLGRTPADYDVATAARPDTVRRIFGTGRTLAIGAAFGVISVLGPRSAGQVAVATFRSDGGYTDGRHPAGVTFCSAQEDAQRRDFTINGLFLDPLSSAIYDFVGGRADLSNGIVRAIGVPTLRFGEDHLRMLRAIRFTAFFGFVLEAETRRALESMKHLVAAVSPERVAAELRAMVSRHGRGTALELLADTGLAAEVLPEVMPPSARAASWHDAARIVAACDEPSLPLTLAVLAGHSADDAVRRASLRLRLSNREAKQAEWLLAGLRVFDVGNPADRPWSRLQPWIAHEHAPALADLLRARASCGQGDPATASWFTAQLARPRAEIDPPPLVTGDLLLAAGVPPGPAVGAALARVRDLQLDGAIATREQAIAAALDG
jgi:tRNA nucleotidyltransferase/poly(A) polymerase